MAHTQTKDPTKYEEKVLKKIVAAAFNEVPGVLGPSAGVLSPLTDKVQNMDDVHVEKGIHVRQKGNEVEIKLKLIIEMGKNIPEITEQIRDKVKPAVETQTDLAVSSIEVDITDTMPREEYESKFRSLKN